MSDHGHAHDHAGHGGHGHGAHAHHGPSYFKTYITLLILLLVSIAGPEVGNVTGIHAITLFTAFGIAIYKAYLVASRFMHLNVEKKLISYLLLAAVAFLFLFFAGVSPDVMKHRGNNWENMAAQDEVTRAEAAAAAGGEAHH